MGEVITVKGPVSPNELGVTLVHEHLFGATYSVHEYSAKVTEASKIAIQKAPVSIEILGALRRDIFLNEDNPKRIFPF